MATFLKKIKLQKRETILIVTVFRQIYLSIYRYSSLENDFETFYTKNVSNVDHAITILEKLIKKHNIPSQKDQPTLHGPIFNRRFYFLLFPSRFSLEEIMELYIIIIRYRNLKNFHDLNIEAATIKIGKPAEIIYWEILEYKVTKKDLKLIHDVEHYGQNEFIGKNYLSIEQILSHY